MRTGTALRAFFSLKKRRNAYCYALIRNPKKRFFLLLLKSAEMRTSLCSFSWALFQPEKAQKSVLPLTNFQPEKAHHSVLLWIHFQPEKAQKSVLPHCFALPGRTGSTQ
jgi:hypothetical protein